MTLNTIPIIFDGKRYTIAGIQHENAYGLVVFLDALGVKGIWETKDTAQVLENWNKVYYLFSDALNDLSGINLSAFSDTLIISMRGHRDLIDRPSRFVEIFCKTIIPPFVRSMHYDFFFRGVITMGDFSRSSRKLIGPAADQSANFYGSPEWIGMSLSPLTGKWFENSMATNESNLIASYNTSQKKEVT
jgi:hypothetical protein